MSNQNDAGKITRMAKLLREARYHVVESLNTVPDNDEGDHLAERYQKLLDKIDRETE